MIRLFLVGFLFVYLGTSLLAQQTYYVSPSGNDAANGSPGNPWQHVQWGVDQMQAGDTLILRDGIYHERIYIDKNDITLKAEHTGGATLDGTGTSGQDAMIEIESASGVRISGLEIRNNIQNDAIGILIAGEGNDIVISHCILHDIHFSADPNETPTSSKNAQGIIVYGTENTPYSNIRIVDNELYDCRLGYSEGIAVNGNVDGFEITGNYLHQLTNIGIDVIGFEGTAPASVDYARNGKITGNRVVECVSPYDTSAGIYVDGGAHIQILYNESSCNGYGMEIGCENTGHEAVDIEVRDNILMFNREAGLAIGGYDYPSGSGKVRDVHVYNNTFWKNDTGTHDFGELYLSYVEDLQVKNNIFYTLSDYFIYAESGQPSLISDYNLFYDTSDQSGTDDVFEFNGTEYTGFTTYVNATGRDTHSIYGSLTLLTDPGNTCGSLTPPVLSYQQGANGINAGDPAYQPLPGETDFFGHPRISEGRVDIGAQESDNQQDIEETSTNVLSVYPNPTEGVLILKTSLKGISSYTVFSTEGKKIKKGRVEDNKINLNALKTGVYFLMIVNKGKIYRIRVIKI